MNPFDLAWKGTTIAQKRELLEHSRKERDRLISEDKAKDGQLGLASTCVDIISTAKAAIKEADARIDADARREWEALLEEALTISKEAVAAVVDANRAAWTPSDFEVAGAIIVQTAKGDIEEIQKGIAILRAGVEKAKTLENFAAVVLLYGQVVRAGMVWKEEHVVEISLLDLHAAIEQRGDLDEKVKTRAYRALAEGSKFLAIFYADKAGSENQKLKAEQI
jgi:hypothetical protein